MDRSLYTSGFFNYIPAYMLSKSVNRKLLYIREIFFYCYLLSVTLFYLDRLSLKFKNFKPSMHTVSTNSLRFYFPNCFYCSIVFFHVVKFSFEV